MRYTHMQQVRVLSNPGPSDWMDPYEGEVLNVLFEGDYGYIVSVPGEGLNRMIGDKSRVEKFIAAPKDLHLMASTFAAVKHAQACHFRSYTGEPYLMHLSRVAGAVYDATGDHELAAIAWLHDTLEDTQTTYEELAAAFSPEIAKGVWHLTDQFLPGKGGNRARRKHLEAERLSKAPDRIKTIKIADLIDNAESIRKHDPAFAKVYFQEAQDLAIGPLEGGDPRS